MSTAALRTGVPRVAAASPVVAVIGPTAAGKSALGVELALRLNGEVVNADSMQLYRGMDIGTAKLRPEERRGVPHHVLDIWDVTEPASVVAYQAVARAAIDDIYARGRVPLLVGGSGLYVRAVLEQFDFPGTDPELRASLEAELARVVQRGCATAVEEYEVGLNALAAPVLDRSGEVIAAVSVSGPSYRLDERRLEACLEPLLAATKEISRRMGWFAG